MTGHRGAMVGCVMALALLALGCEGEAVLDGVTQGAANRAAVVLDESGVSASVRRDGSGAAGWSVWVDSGLVVDARAVLVSHSLPAVEDELPESLEGGLLGPSPHVEHTLLVQRQAAELTSSLLRLDGVVDARVHLMLPYDPWRPEPRGDAQASILLLERAAHPASATDEEISLLIAGAVERLESDAVSVVRVEAVTTRAPNGSAVKQVGPWLVVREHATTLEASLVSLIVLTVGLAVLCGALLLRLRRRPRI